MVPRDQRLWRSSVIYSCMAYNHMTYIKQQLNSAHAQIEKKISILYATQYEDIRYIFLP